MVNYILLTRTYHIVCDEADWRRVLHVLNGRLLVSLNGKNNNR